MLHLFLFKFNNSIFNNIEEHYYKYEVIGKSTTVTRSELFLTNLTTVSWNE